MDCIKRLKKKEGKKGGRKIGGKERGKSRAEKGKKTWLGEGEWLIQFSNWLFQGEEALLCGICQFLPP